MNNVTLYHRADDLHGTNFNVTNLCQEDDGTKTAVIWCTHGDWEGAATFHEDGSVDVRILATSRNVHYKKCVVKL